MGTPQLVFVYNVDGSPVGLLRDVYRGLTTGSTDCNLCDLTFGRMLKDRTWKRFVDDLPLEVDFRLRSTFKKHHPELADYGFPAAFVVSDAGIVELITGEELNRIETLDELRELVTRKVAGIPDQA